MQKTRCPLCGARLTPFALLDAAGELDDPHLGVVAGRCPHCQGYLELRPVAGRLEVGYAVRGAGTSRFDAVLSLDAAGLVASVAAGGAMTVTAVGRVWHFPPAA